MMATMLDYESIRTVKARYCRLLDTKDWEGFMDLFTPSAAMDVQEDDGNRPVHGQAAILDQARFTVANTLGAAGPLFGDRPASR